MTDDAPFSAEADAWALDFHDDLETCPKCRNKDIRTAYAPPLPWLHKDNMSRLCIAAGEHFHRVCQNCHFEWLERADSAKDAKRLPEPPADPVSQAISLLKTFVAGEVVKPKPDMRRVRTVLDTIGKLSVDPDPKISDVDPDAGNFTAAMGHFNRDPFDEGVPFAIPPARGGDPTLNRIMEMLPPLADLVIKSKMGMEARRNAIDLLEVSVKIEVSDPELAERLRRDATSLLSGAVMEEPGHETLHSDPLRGHQHDEVVEAEVDASRREEPLGR